MSVIEERIGRKREDLPRFKPGQTVQVIGYGPHKNSYKATVVEDPWPQSDLVVIKSKPGGVERKFRHYLKLA
jgi:hypothetical protein